jgi:site-specific DNA-methyltransferase (adenine-specific)
MDSKDAVKKEMYFKKGESILYHANCLKLLEKMDDNTFDACITDPPYSISGYDDKKAIGWLKSNKYWTENKKFKKINEEWDIFKEDSYYSFTKLWLQQIQRVVKKNGNIVIFGSYHNIYTIGELLSQADLRIINSIVWYKRNAFPNITQRMFCESTEHIIWAVNESNKKAKNWTFLYEEGKKLNRKKKCTNCNKNFDFSYLFCPFCGKELKEGKNLQMRNLWDVLLTNGKEKKDGKHPAQKPLEVIKRLVLILTKKNDYIIDPFMGIGTIPLVCEIFERKSVGIEKYKKYCEIAKKRFVNINYYKGLIK